MRSFKSYPKLWILDDNPCVSARYLADKDLSKTIYSSFKLLINAYYYSYGVRTLRIYEHFKNDPIKVDQLKDELFPSYPFENIPKFCVSNIIDYKFARQCLNHFDYVKSYFDAIIVEHELRFSKQHKLSEIVDFTTAVKPKLKKIELNDVQYPIRSVIFKYRKNNLIDSMRACYKSKIYSPLDQYNKVSVPDWMNIVAID
jgi:hypothetical protein